MKCKEIWIFWLLYKSNSRNLLFKSDMKLRNATCVLFNTLFQLKNLLIRHVDKLPLRKICLTQFETRIYWRLSKITGKLYFKKLSNTASRCALSLYFWIILFMILLKGLTLELSTLSVHPCSFGSFAIGKTESDQSGLRSLKPL